MLPLSTHDQVHLVVVAGLRAWAHDPWQDWLDVQFRDAQWVRPVDGEWPDPDIWRDRIERAVRSRTDQPCLVLAHGFGALAAIHHATQGETPPASLILFGVADPTRFAIGQEALALRLPCTTSVVASTTTAPDNHPWLHGDVAREWALRWGARFVDAGPGPRAADIPGWGLGQRVLEQHVQQLGQRHRPAALGFARWAKLAA